VTPILHWGCLHWQRLDFLHFSSGMIEQSSMFSVWASASTRRQQLNKATLCIEFVFL
jgi:hypothetical protein